MCKYEIMNRDTVTAFWDGHSLEILDRARIPLFLLNFSDLDSWLQTRAIDGHRANSRLLKKALRMSERDDLSTVKQVYAVTITDNYWIRPLGSDLRYEDVSFSNSRFQQAMSNIALKGKYDSLIYASSHLSGNTAELTNTGSFEKCWKFIQGAWWMIKKANLNERFSEVFICRLGNALGIKMAQYLPDAGAVRTKDFTENGNLNFEPALTFMGENEDYDDNIQVLRKLCPQAVPEYIKMIFLDALVMNPDRHTANYGLIRDAENGDFLGLAPLFDHNMALISRGYFKNSHKDFLIRSFAEVIMNYPEFRNVIPILTEEILQRVIDEVGMKVRKNQIHELIMERYRMIMDLL